MQELVKITESKEVVTDSLTVARYFRKNHRHVLAAIREVIEAGTVHEPDFRLMEREVEIGHGHKRKSPYYQINRDGFSLLAMRFTGKEALVWQIKFVDAFNEMESKLQQSQKTLQEAYTYMRDTFAPLSEDRGKISEHSGKLRLFPRRGSWCSKGKVVVSFNMHQPYLPAFKAIIKNTKGNLEVNIIQIIRK